MITPKELLTFSYTLLNNDEESYRSAVSRAYYAAFHEVRAIAIKERGYVKNTGASAHFSLSKYLRHQPDKQAKIIGSLLANLSNQRKYADYDIHLPFNKASAKHDVAIAKSIIDLANKYL